ncbi:MAG: inositol monophosphatase family protein [Bdellovibrionales bacterium]
MVMRPALINVMVKAAEKAGRGLLRDFGEVEHLQVSRKGPADFVSTADLKAQKTLWEELSVARPSFGFLAEEGDSGENKPDANERWIIDPLDGTSNFLHGVPQWAISIGAERNGEIIAGVVYNPVADELFWAEKGLGAYLNSQRLRVSARRELADCLIGMGTPFKGSGRNYEVFTRELSAVMPLVAGVRRLGAAALDLAYVAAGRFDAFWERGLKPWDVAAGYILVKEAGGFIESLEKGKDPIQTGDVLASNTDVHDKMLKLLREAK